jgi:hypothetical protein
MGTPLFSHSVHGLLDRISAETKGYRAQKRCRERILQSTGNT